MGRGSNEPRVLVCDVDGTLLDPAGRLSDRTARAVTFLAAAGVHVVLASGRILAGLRSLCERLGLTGPQIAMHGALVATPIGEVIAQFPLSTEDVLAHLDFARSMAVPAVLCYPDRLVTDRVTPRVEAAFLPYDEPAPEVCGDLASLAHTGPLKTCLCTDPGLYGEVLKAGRAHFGDRFTLTTANERELELMRAEATKGAAAIRIAEILGVSMAELGAIGDGPNDEALLRAAGISAAVGNAGPSVRAAASFVVPSNSPDGAAEAIARMFPSIFESRPAQGIRSSR